MAVAGGCCLRLIIYCPIILAAILVAIVVIAIIIDASNHRENSFLDEEDSIPISIGRRERGVVTNIKMQTDCECCWAFATVAAIEWIKYYIKTNTLESLSVQQLTG
ncbi:hypothetical protein HHK36_030091 [Tetracentron sinense]|uniref:Peptidase C1A papain C-terminal domain-containing protein n=1 Tax=Tetracentron sinense TaxID=13715 RepID=A0A835CZY7_TETSI|nr:hypothetical protein HHK36_030091 [Tetracentron sinense]